MGCDYYIETWKPKGFKGIKIPRNGECFEKFLEVYVKNWDRYDIFDGSVVSYMDLKVDSEKGYFSYSGLGDEDEEDYEEKVKEYKCDCLTVDFKPIIIYENGLFLRPTFERKYKERLESGLKDKYCWSRHGNAGDKTWDDVDKIVKVERRRERE